MFFVFMINYRKISELPPIIKAFCYSHDGWVVGSSAKFLLDMGDVPRDWDILIPFYSYGNACRLIPINASVNSFGGFKFSSDGVELDVWAGDVGWFLANNNKFPAFAVSPRFIVALSANKGFL